MCHTLLVCGICLSFLLLLLLGSGLRRLLFGCFVRSSLLGSTHHRPGSGSGSCPFSCFIVSNRSDRGASSGTLGGALYTTPFCLLGIVRSCLLLCFLLLFGFGGWGRSLRINSRLLFGRSEASFHPAVVGPRLLAFMQTCQYLGGEDAASDCFEW
jgi:hypothetical protein